MPDLVPSVLPYGIRVSRALARGEPGVGHLPVQLPCPTPGAGVQLRGEPEVGHLPVQLPGPAPGAGVQLRGEPAVGHLPVQLPCPAPGAGVQLRGEPAVGHLPVQLPCPTPGAGVQLPRCAHHLVAALPADVPVSPTSPLGTQTPSHAFLHLKAPQGSGP